MSYRTSVNAFNAKILKWYIAIPVGICTAIVSNLLGGSDTLIGEVIGLFNILILVGIVTGIIDLVRFFKKKDAAE